MRRQLPKGVRMYHGDDFDYAELIAGERKATATRCSHFRCDRAGASAALSALAAATRRSSTRPGADGSACHDTSSRRRRGSTRPAWCSWPI